LVPPSRRVFPFRIRESVGGAPDEASAVRDCAGAGVGWAIQRRPRATRQRVERGIEVF
jgi:hypothetical protein